MKRAVYLFAVFLVVLQSVSTVFLFPPTFALAAGNAPIIAPVMVTNSTAGKVVNLVSGTYWTNDSRPTISATYSDDNAIDQITAVLRLNGVPNPTTTIRDIAHISYTPSSNLVDGSYNSSVDVKDVDANSATRVTQPVKIDTVVPSSSEITSPTNTDLLHGTVTINATAADATAGVKQVDFKYRTSGVGDYSVISSDASAPYSVSWNTAILTSGNYDLIATAVDNAGNTLNSSVVIVSVDNTAPAIPVINDFTSAVTNSINQTVSGTKAIDAAVIKLNTDSTGVSFPTTTTWQKNITLTTGDNNFSAAAIDIFGNESAVGAAKSIILDQTNPTISSILFNGQATNIIANGNSVILTATVNDNYKAYIDTTKITADFSQIGGGAAVAPTSYNSPTGLTAWVGVTIFASAGAKNITVSAIDGAGNSATPLSSTGLTIDTDTPSVTVTSPTSGTIWDGSSHSITWTATDANLNSNSIKLEYSLNNGAAWTEIANSQPNSGSYSWTPPASTSTSQAEIKVSATDLAGQIGIGISSLFHIDNVGPTDPDSLNISSVPPTTNTLPTVTGSISTDTTSVKVHFGATIVDAILNQATHTFSAKPLSALSDGSYNIGVQAFDNLNNFSNLVVINASYRIDTAAPTFNNATRLPADNSTTNNSTPTISIDVADAGSGIDAGSVDMYVGGVPVTANLVGGTITYTSIEPISDGNVAVTVDVKDAAGNSATRESWQFNVNTGPTLATVAATGGTVASTYLNNSNTGVHIIGTVLADTLGAQTIQFFFNNNPFSVPFTSIIPKDITGFDVALPTSAFSELRSIEGLKTITAQTTGFTGNISSLSNSVAITIDTATPTIPDSSKISLIQNTPGQNDTVTGSLASVEGNSAVKIYGDASLTNLVSGGVAGIAGNFLAMSIGDNANADVYIVAVDTAGNISPALHLINDIFAPATPSISTPADNTYSNNPTPIVTGTAEIGSTVTVYSGVSKVGSGKAVDGNFSITIGSLGSDGNKTLTAKTVNAVGDTSGASGVTNYILDRVAPSLSELTLTNSTIPSTQYSKNNDTVILTATITDLNQGAITASDISADLSPLGGGVSVAPATYNNISGLATWTGVTISAVAGSKTINISATDQANNNSIGSTTIMVDNSAPLTLMVNDDGVYTNSITSLHATWTGSDPESEIADNQYAIGTTAGGTDVRVFTSTGATQSMTATGLTLTNGQIYYITVKVKNGAGAWSIPIASDGITIDVAPPIVNVTGSPTTATYNNMVPVTITFADGLSGLQLSTAQMLLGLSGQQMPVPTTYAIGQLTYDNGGFGFDDGTYYASAQISDNVNNQTAWQNWNFKIDTVAPTGSISINSNNVATNSTAATLTLNVADSNLADGSAGSSAAQMRFSNDNISWTNWETYAQTKVYTLPSGDGVKTVYVQFKDAAGNASGSYSDEINFDATAPVITVDPYSTAPKNTDLTVTASTNEGTLNTASHTFTTNGSFTFTATDAANNSSSTTVTITNIDKVAPTMSGFSVSPNPAKSGSVLTIKFTASEALVNNPTVTVNANSASYVSNSGLVYTYNYTVAGTETNGVNVVSVALIDMATNVIVDATNSTILDFTAPITTATVAPSSPNGSAGWYKTTAPTVTLSTTDGTIYYHWNSDSDVVYSTTLTAPEGNNILHYHAVDAAGNVESDKTRELRVDTIKPASVLPTDAGSKTGNKALTFNWTTPAETGSGIDHYEIYINNSATMTGAPIHHANIGNVLTYALTASDQASITDATWYATVKAYDVTGNVSIGNGYSNGIIVDSTAPTGGSISINAGATYAIDNSVALTLNATDSWTPIQMNFSNDNFSNSSGWETYSATKTYTLPAGDGAKTVYVKFKDAGDNTTVVYSSSVTLDTTAPNAPTSLTSTLLSGGRVKIDFTASTSSDAANYKIYSDGGTGTINYLAPVATLTSPTTTWTSGALNGAYKYVVRATDNTGNQETNTTIVAVTADGVAPSFTGIATNKVAYKSGETMTITFSPSETLSAAPVVWVSDLTHLATYGSFIGGVYTYTYSITGLEAQGTQTIHVSGLDIVNNNGSSDGNVILDFTAPVITGGSPSGFTTNALPTISVQIADTASGVNSGANIMRVNGVVVAANWDGSTNTLSWAPSRALRYQSYSVTVDSKDLVGNVATRYRFSFTVKP